MAQILDGKALSGQILENLKTDIAHTVAEGAPPPGLGILTVGNNPASRTYVRNKLKKAARAGFYTRHISLPQQATQAEVLEAVRTLNTDPAVHGFIVQLPLPQGLDEDQILSAVSPAKDADGFHPENLGRIVAGHPRIFPATPAGVMRLLRAYEIPTEGKHVVIAGRSRIVGKPLSLMMADREGGNAAVTLIHSRVPGPERFTRQADIFVSAVGRPRLWKAGHFRPGVTIIDVGINYDEEGNLCGDVDFPSVEPMAPAPSPPSPAA